MKRTPEIYRLKYSLRVRRVLAGGIALFWLGFMVASARTLLDTIATATPVLYEAFAAIMPLIGTDDEPALIENLYGFPGEINFFDRVLALVPERLAVLRVRGVKWSDLGDPKRAFASIRTAGVRPRWAESC